MISELCAPETENLFYHRKSTPFLLTHAAPQVHCRRQDKAMLLQRLLAVSGRLRRSLSTSTAASRPPWIMLEKLSPSHASVPRACVRVEEPPRVSRLCLPANLVTTSVAPDPHSDVERLHIGQVCSVSSDGLLFLQVSVHDYDTRARARQVPQATGFHRGRSRTLDTERFVCNALTGQLSRIPDLDMGGPTPRKARFLPSLGLITQADRGHGPPNRFALADLKRGMMLRFLSETGEWDECAVTAPYQLPLARPFCPPRGMSDQEAFPFGGRLWWVDLTWGAISADPFCDRPEPQFVELPTGSVLPARTLPDPMNTAETLCRYRRMGVSEGRLCYAEVSEQEPFVLSFFALDDQEGSGWTLEHRLVLSQLWADGGHPWLPLPEKTTPQIGALHPLNANVVYLMVGSHVLGVDMEREEVTWSSLPEHFHYCMPCVLPPWLASTKIPPIGMKGAVRNKTLADVLVRSDKHKKT